MHKICSKFYKIFSCVSILGKVCPLGFLFLFATFTFQLNFSVPCYQERISCCVLIKLLNEKKLLLQLFLALETCICKQICFGENIKKN